MTSLRMPGRVLDDLVAHAREEWPDECCGLLIGRGDAIDRAVRARNARRSVKTYLIDPRDHFAALKTAREIGAEVVGYYHSHPNSSPEPSPTDRREAVAGPHYYVIVSPGAGDDPPSVAAYWLLHGNFQQVPLVRVG